MNSILNEYLYRYINRHKPTQYDKMHEHSKGKIHYLLNIIDDEIYVGSTVQPLRKRLCEHKCKAKGNERSHYKLYHHMTKYSCIIVYIYIYIYYVLH